MYEGMEGAIKVALIDFTLVFVILGLLALSMIALGKIVKLTSRKELEKKVVDLPRKDFIKARGIPELKEEKEKNTIEIEEERELIAVISVAVSIFLEKPTQKINIINIRRSIPAEMSPWNISGKHGVVSNRISVSSRKRGGI